MMDAVRPSGTWQCPICSSSFSRLEHLRRHGTSHDERRPYECEWCQSTFKRRDALRRHEKICRVRFPSDRGCYSETVIGAEYRQPKRVCLAGEGTGPSQQKLSEEAIGDFNVDQFIHDIPSPLDFTTLDTLYSSIGSDIILAERLEYLAYFTSARGMATFLDKDTLEQKQKLLINHTNGEERISSNNTDNSSVYRDNATTPDVFEPISQRIITALQEIITQKPNSNIIALDWNSSTEEQCRNFFSPENIRRFRDLFWSLWYPNCPIVHRPLFNPETASVALLSIMLIIGACMSPDEQDGKMARKWLDSVEELTFNLKFFTDSTPQESMSIEGQSDYEKKRLECIQSAYLVCSSQKREGSVAAQARIRRYRHTMMVMLARDIKLGAASHRNLRLDYASLNWWRQFAVEEELIRTVTYVFLFDAALTIFHNSPPRMVVSELKMDMACPEASFQAESASDCFSLLKEWEKTVFWRERQSVASVVRKVCQKDLDDNMVLEFSHMGTLNFFTNIQALHSLIFHLQNFVFESTLSPVQIGLENWRRIWNKRQPEDKDIPNHPDTLWKKIGFLRYSPEFWQLARIIVAKALSKLSDESDNQEPEQDVSIYDHTNMADVNGLIMEYRRMSLGSL